MLMNKNAIVCWNILKYEIESIIDKFVPMKKQGKWPRKKHISKEAIRKMCGGFIRVPERMKTMQITKRHSMQLQIKLNNLKEHKKMTARVFMNMSGVNKMYKTRSDL